MYVHFSVFHKLQIDRRVADERELSDSEDEEGDKRRDESNAKQVMKKHKPNPELMNGRIVF